MRINRFIPKTSYVKKPDSAPERAAQQALAGMKRTGSQLMLADYRRKAQTGKALFGAGVDLVTQGINDYIKAEQTSQYITIKNKMSKELTDVELDMRQIDVEKLKEMYGGMGEDVAGKSSKALSPYRLPIPGSAGGYEDMYPQEEAEPEYGPKIEDPADQMGPTYADYFQKYYEDKRAAILAKYEPEIKRSLARRELNNWWDSEQVAADARAGSIGLQRGMQYLKADLELNIKNGIRDRNFPLVMESLKGAVATGVINARTAADAAADAEHDIAYWKVLEHMKLNTPDLESTRDFLNNREDFQKVITSAGLDPDILEEKDKANLLSVMTREINLNEAIRKQQEYDAGLKEYYAIGDGLYELKSSSSWDADEVEKIELMIRSAGHLDAISPHTRKSLLDELYRITAPGSGGSGGGGGGSIPMPVPLELQEEYAKMYCDPDVSADELMRWTLDHGDEFGWMEAMDWSKKAEGKPESKLILDQNKHLLGMASDFYAGMKDEFPEMALEIDIMAGKALSYVYDVIGNTDYTYEQQLNAVSNYMDLRIVEDRPTRDQAIMEFDKAVDELEQIRNNAWKGKYIGFTGAGSPAYQNIKDLLTGDESILIEVFGKKPIEARPDTNGVYRFAYAYVDTDGTSKIDTFAVRPAADGDIEIVRWDEGLGEFTTYLTMDAVTEMRKQAGAKIREDAAAALAESEGVDPTGYSLYMEYLEFYQDKYPSYKAWRDANTTGGAVKPASTPMSQDEIDAAQSRDNDAYARYEAWNTYFGD